MHRDGKHLAGHLADAAVVRTHQEVVLHVDVAVAVEDELQEASLAVDLVAGLQHAQALLLRHAADNPERADGHVVVVVETDETDGHKRAAVHLKARLNLLLTAELLHAEANLLLLKGFYNELGGMIRFHIGSPF